MSNQKKKVEFTEKEINILKVTVGAFWRKGFDWLSVGEIAAKEKIISDDSCDEILKKLEGLRNETKS